jgi:hypothetical protein
MTTLTERIAREIAEELKEHPERLAKHFSSDPLKGDLIQLICRHAKQSTEIVIAAFRYAAGGKLLQWMDAPERTVEDVIALCEKVAG